MKPRKFDVTAEYNEGMIYASIGIRFGHDQTSQVFYSCSLSDLRSLISQAEVCARKLQTMTDRQNHFKPYQPMKQ